MSGIVSPKLALEVVVGYFDWLAERGFRRDAQGRDIFYAFLFPKGRVVGNDKARPTIVRALKARYMVLYFGLPPAKIALCLLGAVKPPDDMIVALLLIAIWLVEHQLTLRRLVASFPITNDGPGRRPDDSDSQNIAYRCIYPTLLSAATITPVAHPFTDRLPALAGVLMAGLVITLSTWIGRKRR